MHADSFHHAAASWVVYVVGSAHVGDSVFLELTEEGGRRFFHDAAAPVGTFQGVTDVVGLFPANPT